MNEKPVILISSCLLGDPVRYNRSHKKDKWIDEKLSKYVDFIPVCPELEMGLGVPRETMNLSYSNDQISLKTKFTGNNLTDLAQKTFKKIINDLNSKKVNGFIFTNKSPTCGLNIAAYNSADTTKAKFVRGLFSSSIMESFPSTPLIDSGKIKNFSLKNIFVKQVFAHHNFFTTVKNLKDLQVFHQKYKYTLMAHSPSRLKKLGVLAANPSKIDFSKLKALYFELFFEAINLQIIPNRQINALTHILGHLKKKLSSNEKKNILSIFNDYSSNLLPENVPIKILEHLAIKYDDNYLLNQKIFSPYPKEL